MEKKNFPTAFVLWIARPDIPIVDFNTFFTFLLLLEIIYNNLNESVNILGDNWCRIWQIYFLECYYYFLFPSLSEFSRSTKVLLSSVDMVDSIFINFFKLLLSSGKLCFYASVMFRDSSLYILLSWTLNIYLKCFVGCNSIDTGLWYESHLGIDVEVQENLQLSI